MTAAAKEPAFRLELAAAASHTIPVELAAEQCGEDIVALYADAVDRVQQSLKDLR